ncbi:MAG: LON peptidase substrate-binding domain-containing protein, partial [Deinococcota bacterium]
MEWELPVIALRTETVMPRTLHNVDVGRPKSKRALEEAQATDNRVLLLAQREPSVDDPLGEDLYDIGTLGVIKQVIRLPDDTLQVLVEGRERAKVAEFIPGLSLRARVDTLAETGNSADKQRPLMEQVKGSFEKYAQQNKTLRLDSFHLENLRSLRDPGALSDAISKYSTWNIADKQRILEETDVGKRLELVYEFLSRDLERFDTEKQVSARVKQQMDANQREYYLREQMKAIQKELGGGEDVIAETEELRERIKEKAMPEHAEKRALKELDRLEKMPGGSPEATVVRTYLDTLLDLPWSEMDEEHLDIKHTETVLDEDHYALEEPKDRILEFLAVRQLTKDMEDATYKAPILCFVGPPGVGKTSLGKSIARSLNRQFVRMSLGGVRDEAE